MSVRHFLQISFLVLMMFSQLSCQRDEAKRPSVMIIGIERLRHQDLNCTVYSHNEDSGFATLCNEAHRFQHAWLSSTHSLPNLGSVLSGPLSINTNRDAISTDVASAGQIAFQKGYRTGFWTSGPPFLRASRIMQGFEFIDDHWTPRNMQVARPLREISDEYISWIHESTLPSFTVVTVSDLNEPWIPTTNELDEARSLTIDSMLEEVDHKLNRMFEQLRKSNRWNNTWVIVTGLSGRSDSDRAEPATLNLHSENMQVALFIKPPRPNNSRFAQRNFEENIGLSDLNATLKEILGAELSMDEKSNSFLRFFESEELPRTRRKIRQSGVWYSPNNDVYQVNGWRVDQFLVKGGSSRAQIYNSLVDSFERTLWSDSQGELLSLARELSKDAKLKSEISPKFKSWQNIDLWSDISRSKLIQLLNSSEDGALKDLLIYLIEQKSDLRLPDSTVTPPHPCEIAFPEPKSAQSWKNCSLTLIQILRDWIDNPQDTKLTHDLAVEFTLLFLRESALRTDLALGRPWNIPTKEMESAWVFERLLRKPSRTDFGINWKERTIDLKKSVRRKFIF